ncbi:hypothetical protein BC829DRAFT_417754 [Chytridium lagenaria]|nr:hypothetical protein BC829DRAFT_417754 [Chytridium lagenaria]
MSVPAGCIRLEGSNACPEFQNALVSIANVPFTDVATFDTYILDLDSLMTLGFDCPTYARTSLQFYQTTWCAFLVDASIERCGENGVNQVCSNRVDMFQKTLAAAFADATQCNPVGGADAVRQRGETLTSMELLASRVRESNPCVDGVGTDLTQCGFSDPANAITYCETASQIDSCCGRVAGFTGPTIPASTVVAPVIPSAPAAPAGPARPNNSLTPAPTNNAIGGAAAVPTTTTTPSSSSSSSPNFLLIGGAAGGVVLLVVIITVSMLIIKKRRGSSSRRVSMEAVGLADMGGEKVAASVPPGFVKPASGQFDETGRLMADVAPPGRGTPVGGMRQGAAMPGQSKYPPQGMQQQGRMEMLDVTMEVVYNYVPNLSDEVQLFVGDPVLVKCKFDDGWGYGINLTTNEEGSFPLACLSGFADPPEPPPNVPSLKLLVSVFVNACPLSTVPLPPLKPDHPTEQGTAVKKSTTKKSTAQRAPVESFYPQSEYDAAALPQPQRVPVDSYYPQSEYDAAAQPQPQRVPVDSYYPQSEYDAAAQPQPQRVPVDSYYPQSEYDAAAQPQPQRVPVDSYYPQSEYDAAQQRPPVDSYYPETEYDPKTPQGQRPPVDSYYPQTGI